MINALSSNSKLSTSLLSYQREGRTNFAPPFSMPPEPKRRTIAFITFTGLQSVGSWPATAASMVRALEEAGHTVIRIKPTGSNTPFIWKAIQGLYRMAGLRFQSERQEAVVRQLAASVSEQLQGLKPDLLLSSSSLPLPFIKVDCPLAFWTDATFSGMLGFYDEFAKLSKITVRNGLHFETLALGRADMAIYSSEWAASSAIADHGADPSKVFVIPFGPNLSNPPSRESVLQSIATRSRTECRLLFMGYDWDRKQGPLVLATHRELLRRGINSHFTIVGCEPDLGKDRKGISVLGLIDKNDPAQIKKLQEVMGRTHFLVVPSKAECFGMVYAEASAYGIPSIGCDVGGVSTAVRAGHNGMLFPVDVDPALVADHIQSTWSDGDVYTQAATMAREYFEECLNWPTAVERLSALMDGIKPRP